MARRIYGIIADWNFKTREYVEMRAIHDARRAVEADRCYDTNLISCLDDLEQVLSDHADRGDAESARICNEAESRVALRWKLLAE